MKAKRSVISILSFIIIFVCSIFSKDLSAQVNFTAVELLGRVTDQSISINVETDAHLDYYFEYGTETGFYTGRVPNSGSLISEANEPFEVTIDGLSANTRYYYRLVYSSDNGTSWIEREEHSFHTQRTVESSFVFTIISDSHTSTESASPGLNLLSKAFQNVKDDNPDLHFDLGDTFAMTNVTLGDSASVRDEYLSQRSIMSTISPSIPVYLVLGNHEDEEGWNLDDAGAEVANSKPIMSTNGRKRYYLNPIPDDFYSGNNNNSQLEINDDHLRESYFSFEWGDALFLSIDPYWNTQTKPFSGTAGGEENDEVNGDRWDWTLGEEQYLWLKETLESSTAKWKFVFSHQVVGGASDYGRGGAEATNDYEWGANSEDFASHRPDWTYNTSIHQLLVDNGVTIFFHGHDHVFAKEEIDNMIYQECPQPSDISYSNGFGNYENSETTVVVNNSGHLRVSVSTEEVTVDYIRAYLPAQGTNGSIGHTYSISDETGVNSIAKKSFDSYHIYPNPLNNKATIEFNIPKTQHVRVAIYDLMGVEMVELLNSNVSPGWQQLDFDGNKLAPGHYFAKIEIDGYSKVKKMIILK